MPGMYDVKPPNKARTREMKYPTKYGTGGSSVGKRGKHSWWEFSRVVGCYASSVPFHFLLPWGEFNHVGCCEVIGCVPSVTQPVLQTKLCQIGFKSWNRRAAVNGEGRGQELQKRGEDARRWGCTWSINKVVGCDWVKKLKQAWTF